MTGVQFTAPVRSAVSVGLSSWEGGVAVNPVEVGIELTADGRVRDLTTTLHTAHRPSHRHHALCSLVNVLFFEWFVVVSARTNTL